MTDPLKLTLSKGNYKLYQLRLEYDAPNGFAVTLEGETLHKVLLTLANSMMVAAVDQGVISTLAEEIAQGSETVL